jgi:hypothetical protein
MMPSGTERSARLRNGLIWIAFALALVLATAPVWGRLAYGFNPTFDQLARLASCTNLGRR